MRADVKLEAHEPFALQGEVTFSANDASNGDVAARLRGTLANAEVSLQARSRGASGAAKLILAPFEVQPLTRLEFSAQEIDPQAWLAGAPRVRCSAPKPWWRRTEIEG